MVVSQDFTCNSSIGIFNTPLVLFKCYQLVNISIPMERKGTYIKILSNESKSSKYLYGSCVKTCDRINVLSVQYFFSVFFNPERSNPLILKKQ